MPSDSDPGLPQPGALRRRDCVHGLLLAGSGLGAARAEEPPDPALRTGLQGQTDALNTTAHAARDDPAFWRNAAVLRDGEDWDLIVVGAGLSGLAGAHLFRQHAGRPVRILLLDALDEVGGHARRNEFVSRSGRRLIGYGGSQSLDSPGLFSPATQQLLREVGVELKRFEDGAFDSAWAARHGLNRTALHFGAEAWGEARTVLREADESPLQWLPRTPLSAAAQATLARLLGPGSRHDPWPGLRTGAARRAALAGLSYREYLRRHWGADAQVLRWFQHQTEGYFGVGIDATTALDAWAAGLPGFEALALGDQPDPRQSPSGRHLLRSRDDYIYHFPDGNAGVARALLRSLIPQALPEAQGMDGLVDARIHHAALDRAGAAVCLRLRATVLGLRHLGAPARAEQVELRYVDGEGRQRAVRGRQVLLACWHRVIARLTDELPAAQRLALDDQVKVPLLYATVQLGNWRAWQRAGVQGLRVVDGFWGDVGLDFPVRLGGQRPPEDPEEPILLHLGKVVVPGNGRPAREQAALGRQTLLAWDFGFLERQIRTLLNEALGAQGFRDPDIEAITVNRWAHGYSYEYMRPWDPYWPRGPLPCERARRGWGRVAIANSDAGAYAYAHGAIDQATRAVKELLPRARLPAWHRFPGPPMR